MLPVLLVLTQFNGLTAAQLARLRLPKEWLSYLDALYASRCVHAAAVGVKVRRNTAFRRRYRFVDQVKFDRPGLLNGAA